MAMPPLLRDTLSLPVICSPMFIVSGLELVLAQCRAGIVGSFPAVNARPQSELDRWLGTLCETLQQEREANPGRKIAPFAVNQVCHPTNDRLEVDMEACVRHRVPLIITSLQSHPWMIDAAHNYGGLVFHDVTNVRHARRAVRNGVDGLILVCVGAGGHAGVLSPFALISEIREFFDGPIALAGAISNGQSIFAARAMGADLAYMGTRFIASSEANAVDEYKQMILDSAAEDVVYSAHFSGIKANYLAGSVRKAGLDPDNLPETTRTMDFRSGGESEAKVWRDIWGAGQGIGAIATLPSVGELVAEMSADYGRAARAVAEDPFLQLP